MTSGCGSPRAGQCARFYHVFEPKSGVGGVLAWWGGGVSSHLQSACFLEFPCLLTRTVLTWKLAAIPLRSPVSSVGNALLSPTGTREACWFGVAPRTLERGEGRRTPRWDLPLEFVHSPAFGKYRKENWIADLGSVLILSSGAPTQSFSGRQPTSALG